MAFVNLNTDDLMIPVLVPRTAPIAIAGWDSMWVVGGLLGAALLAGWAMVRVAPPTKTKPQEKAKKRRKLRLFKKKAARKKR